jgi:hypothetical protein
VSVHGAPPEARRIGDLPDAGVAVVRQERPSRVDDLRAVQRGIAASTTLGTVLSQPRGVLAPVLKWNTLTHLVLPELPVGRCFAALSGYKWITP